MKYDPEDDRELLQEDSCTSEEVTEPFVDSPVHFFCSKTTNKYIL